MANVSKDLGPVSAYAVAVAHGFTGTEEEWARLQMQSGANAQRAETAAGNAEAAAQNAGTQATDATNSAENAAKSAQDAGTQATNAAKSAQDAGTQAANAANSASAAAKSAADAKTNVDNATAEAKEAVQESANASEASALRSESAADRAEAAARTQAQIDDAIASFEKVWSSRRTVERLCPAFEKSGGIVSCYPVEGYPLGVRSQIEAVQEGSGDPSPENVRPISGWDGARLTRCGRNLLPYPYATMSVQEANGITISVNGDGTVTVNGTCTAMSGYVLCSAAKLNLKSGYKYYVGDVNGMIAKANVYISYRNTKTGEVTYKYNNSAFVWSDDYQLLQIYIQVSPGISVDNLILKPYLCVEQDWESIKNDWEIYQGDAYTVQFGETVYGGEYRWEMGELIITHDGQTALNEPRIVRLDPQIIPALNGENTLWSDTGETAVAGRTDPVHVIETMQERLAALENALINNI